MRCRLPKIVCADRCSSFVLGLVRLFAELRSGASDGRWRQRGDHLGGEAAMAICHPSLFASESQVLSLCSLHFVMMRSSTVHRGASLSPNTLFDRGSCRIDAPTCTKVCVVRDIRRQVIIPYTLRYITTGMPSILSISTGSGWHC